MQSRLPEICAAIVRVHEQLREAIMQRCRGASADELATVTDRDGSGDVTFAIDVAAESLLADALEAELIGLETSMVVLFEGQKYGPLVLPRGTSPSASEFRSIWDPLDGSRLLSYQLHSGWILTAVAPNRGDDTTLADAVIAVQTEVPTLNQRESAALSVVGGRQKSEVRGQKSEVRGVLDAHLVNVETNDRRPLALLPSQATSIESGFVANECYFEGPAGLLAEIEEQIVLRALGKGKPGEARVWRDTQASSAGTLYNLLSGKLRWAHDFRPLMREALRARGEELSLCAHPYDLCTAPLLCEALDVPLADPWGAPFNAPMSVSDDVAWVGYANRDIAAKLAPIVREVLERCL